MKIQLSAQNLAAHKSDHLVVGVCSAPQSKATPAKKGAKKKASSKAKKPTFEVSDALAEIDAATDGALLKLASEERFKGNEGDVVTLSTTAGAASRVTLVGLGDKEALSLDTLRKAAGRGARATLSRNLDTVSLAVPSFDDLDDHQVAQAIAEGALLANYRFDKYLSEKCAPEIKTLTLVGPHLKGAAMKNAVSRAEAICSGVNLARDLVNEPPASLTPEQFAAEARKVGRESNLTVNVFGEKELAREKMGLFLAVAKAALPYTPPRMVRLAYRPKKKAKKHIVLVGKGLTFDSGGLDLKPAAGMLEMKIDMGGAAAVLGAMKAIGKLKPDVAVTGFLGCAENGIGGNAYHPGDVIKSRKGDTVEINNTDAEGRLVLADTIDYALTKEKPDVLIDLATLTGACMVALGPSTAGLFSDDDELVADILTNGDRSGEDFWRLPLNDALAGQLKSSIADTKNTGERMGGAITAGLFLKRFVDGRATWAHLDIAGPTTQDGDHPYQPRGGAGFGVRTLVGLVQSA